MKKILNVKEYVSASKGQFIPLERETNSDVIQKAQRIKDGEIFSINNKILTKSWNSQYGMLMSASPAIVAFMSDYINILIAVICSDSNGEVAETYFEEMEINNITYRKLYSLTLDCTMAFDLSRI